MAEHNVTDELHTPDAVRSETAHAPVVIGARHLTIEDVVAIARGGAPVKLNTDIGWRERIERGAARLRDYLAGGGILYGVTTGYGDACVVDVPPSLVEALPLQLTRYHGCGMGDWFDAQQTLAIVAARLNSLAFGYSGVRFMLLERLADLVNHRILPRIPSEGSVGASGDLTPLSYVAAALAGERTVLFDGAECDARDVWSTIGHAPLQLAPKEGLALMNGTAVMTGLACLAFARADNLTRIAARLTALTTVALDGRAAHFDARLFEAKPHAGQADAALLATEYGSSVAQLLHKHGYGAGHSVTQAAVDAEAWVRCTKCTYVGAPSSVRNHEKKH